MKKALFLVSLMIATISFVGCEKDGGTGKNPSFDQVEKHLLGTWRAVQTVDRNGNKEDDPIEVLWMFEKVGEYHDYAFTVTEDGKIGIANRKFMIEPMSGEHDVVIYYSTSNGYDEQYLITQINASTMRWQMVTNHDPKTKSEEGYIFKKIN